MLRFGPQQCAKKPGSPSSGGRYDLRILSNLSNWTSRLGSSSTRERWSTRR